MMYNVASLSVALGRYFLLVTWYGTAGFCIDMADRVFLIDPYLRRNAAARPVLPFGLESVTQANEIFVSHGHFDHVADVPQIVRQTGARVYCAPAVAEALRRHGVDDAQLVAVHDGDRYDFDAYQAQCFRASHVRFDLPLVVRTALRSLPAILGRVGPLFRMRHWPQGQVLSWRFVLKDGRVVQHMGSAGSTEEELVRIGALASIDVLMLALQGHSRICQIATRIVTRLRPRVVVPHHHDDFYPPISQMVDIAPFVEALSHLDPPVEVCELPLGEPSEI
jgi:L-ascorbate metabolism protein UlaG (beta-lactamase superfamily)